MEPNAWSRGNRSKKQVRQIANSIKRIGFTKPVVVSDEGDIPAGHGRVAVARHLGFRTVPTLALSHLGEAAGLPRART